MKAWMSLFLLWPLPAKQVPPEAREMVVWNVGQGQWVTVKDQGVCRHFDMGGDRNPLAQVLKDCGLKENQIFLSHGDLDHLNFIRSYAQRARKVCLAPLPLEMPPIRAEALSHLPRCIAPSAPVKKIFGGLKTNSKKSRNANSQVYQDLQAGLLAPGDSAMAQEKKWLHSLVACPRWLVLGHHGSRTSTSLELLKHLQCLKGGVVSARQVKYGHPHKEVVQRMAQMRIPLLRTEDWGHLRIQF